MKKQRRPVTGLLDKLPGWFLPALVLALFVVLFVTSVTMYFLLGKIISVLEVMSK